MLFALGGAFGFEVCITACFGFALQFYLLAVRPRVIALSIHLNFTHVKSYVNFFGGNNDNHAVGRLKKRKNMAGTGDGQRIARNGCWRRLKGSAKRGVKTSGRQTRVKRVERADGESAGMRASAGKSHIKIRRKSSENGNRHYKSK